MSLDKLIAAATDYFLTGADMHRASLTATADLQKAHAEYEKRQALAGGGGKITDLSGRVAPNDPPVGTVSDKSGHFDIPTTATADVVSATKKVATKATKPAAAVETPADEPATASEAAANQAENDAMLAHAAKAAADVKTEAPEAYNLDGPGPEISYEEDIRPVLRAKSLANRDKLVALLAEFNVKSGQELTADQYPAFLAGLKAI